MCSFLEELRVSNILEKPSSQDRAWFSSDRKVGTNCAVGSHTGVPKLRAAALALLLREVRGISQDGPRRTEVFFIKRAVNPRRGSPM